MMKTNDLCADIGYFSINHEGETLCGDHVEVVETEDGKSTVIVLADGLGSRPANSAASVRLISAGRLPNRLCAPAPIPYASPRRGTRLK